MGGSFSPWAISVLRIMRRAIGIQRRAARVYVDHSDFVRRFVAALLIQDRYRLHRRRKRVRAVFRRQRAVECALTGERQSPLFCVSLVRGRAVLPLHVPTLATYLEGAEPPFVCPVTRTPLDPVELRRITRAAYRLGVPLTDLGLRARGAVTGSVTSLVRPGVQALVEEGSERVRAVAAVIGEGLTEEGLLGDLVGSLAETLQDLYSASIDDFAALLLMAKRELPDDAVGKALEVAGVSRALGGVVVYLGSKG